MAKKVISKDRDNKSEMDEVDLTAHYRPFMDVVAQSPFAAMEEHFKMVHECIKAMHRMFDLYMDGRFEEARGLWQKVQEIEHEADKIKNTIRDKMPKALFMPINRDNVSLLLKLQDRLADAAEDVSDILASRDTAIPAGLKSEFKQHMDYTMKAVDLLEDAVHDVDKLLSSSFRKKDVKATQDKLHRVSDLEWKADDVKRALRRKIYSLEGKESPIAVFHMLRLLQKVDDIANNAETMEGALRTVILK